MQMRKGKEQQSWSRHFQPGHAMLLLNSLTEYQRQARLLWSRYKTWQRRPCNNLVSAQTKTKVTLPHTKYQTPSPGWGERLLLYQSQLYLRSSLPSIDKCPIIKVLLLSDSIQPPLSELLPSHPAKAQILQQSFRAHCHWGAPCFLRLCPLPVYE